MANPEHLAKLSEGVEAWNQWKGQTPDVKADFRQADLRGAMLAGADLIKADMFGANLAQANLSKAKLARAYLTQADLHDADLSHAILHGALLESANFEGANLTRAQLDTADLSRANLRRAVLTHASMSSAMLHRADLSGADVSWVNLNKSTLSSANFHGANLHKATLSRAYMTKTDFSGADLSQADLLLATLIEANLEGANLTQCRVYGISAWDVRLEGALQSNLVITRVGEDNAIQVDNLEIAQFIYLLLNNEKIRHVINTITSKVVLILGRFTPERKIILDTIREELRKRDYLPVLFDFAKPSNRDLTETVRTLAHMARFIIADLTDAKSIPQELMAIVPNLPSVPVQPLLLESQQEYGMFEHFRRYPWVLQPVLYKDQGVLLAELETKVIAPAQAKANEQSENRSTK